MTGRNPGFVGNRDTVMCPHNCYKALGDAEAWVTIAAGSEAEWRALCQAMGKPTLADDPRFGSAALRKRNEDELDRIISEWTAQRDRWETTELLQRQGVAAFPTLNNKDLAEDKHISERAVLWSKWIIPKAESCANRACHGPCRQRRAGCCEPRLPSAPTPRRSWPDCSDIPVIRSRPCARRTL